MQALFTVMFILGLALQSFVDACGRKPTKPATAAATMTDATIEITTIYSVRRLNCTHREIMKEGCLNGGRCFTMILGGSRVSACQCPASYTGRRCEAINFLPVKSNNQLKIAGIAASLASLFLVLVFIVCALGIFLKRRQAITNQSGPSQDESCTIATGDHEEKSHMNPP